MWTKSRSIILSSVLVKVLLVMLVISDFFLPQFAKWYDGVSEKNPIFVPLLVCMYLTTTLALIAVFSLDRMISNINKEEIFVARNVLCLRVISWCCFGVAGVFFFLMFFRPIVLPVVFLAGLFGLIIRVIKNVFDKAIDLREENDFTI